MFPSVNAAQPHTGQVGKIRRRPRRREQVGSTGPGRSAMGAFRASVNAVVEALEGRTLLSAAVVPWAVVRNGHPSAHFGGSAVSAAADASLPAAPTGVDLAAVSDTGVSSSDDVTRFNNATPGASLQFVVSGTLSGATVTVYADGTAIGTAVASGPTTTVTTNGSSALANGVRTIAATQTTSDGESPASPALPVTIDTIGPAASSNPPAVYGGGATAYLFGVTYDDEVGVDGGSFDSSDVRVTGPNGFNQLASFVAAAAPSGGTRSATYRVTPPGGSWDAADNGTYTVAVAAGQVRDTAGNFVAAGAVGTVDGRDRGAAVPAGPGRRGRLGRVAPPTTSRTSTTPPHPPLPSSSSATRSRRCRDGVRRRCSGRLRRGHRAFDDGDLKRYDEARRGHSDHHRATDGPGRPGHRVVRPLVRHDRHRRTRHPARPGLGVPPATRA